MGISLSEATGCLLAGKPLQWKRFEKHQAGSLTLSTPRQRRLFAFMPGQCREAVGRGRQELRDAIVATWNDDGVDPASDRIARTRGPSKDVWRLHRIEASSFGGLTVFGGPPFDSRVDGKNWCLYGQNGSGKTSLASAIPWALTGRRIREQEGPVVEQGERSAVTGNTGRRLGDWPSFASYPATPADLARTVEVWVRLTFLNQQGEVAMALRRMKCSAQGVSKPVVEVDSRLLTAPELLETGLLMPARLTRIGFGNKGQALYEAVKMLTGLDQLADLADGCGKLVHRGGRFLEYARENGLDRWKTKCKREVARAEREAGESQFVLPEKRTPGGRTLVAELQQAAIGASRLAGAHLETLQSEIAPGIERGLYAKVAKNPIAASIPQFTDEPEGRVVRGSPSSRS